MLNELQVGEFLAALGDRTPTPASGSATALTGALAAALAELAGRVAGGEEAGTRANALVTRLGQLAGEGAAGFPAVLAGEKHEEPGPVIQGAHHNAPPAGTGAEV